MHRRDRFAWLCQQVGIVLPDDAGARYRAARAADRFFYREAGRPDSWTEAWWIEQSVVALAELGLPVALAEQIATYRRTLTNTFVLDPEAIPVLEELRARGYQIGLVSNWNGTLAATCDELGLTRYVDFVGDSTGVGQAKPAPALFLHVLEQLNVAPAAAFHDGDHYDADVAGARAAGITPILIDIFGHDDRACALRATGLRDVLALAAELDARGR